jgi:hydrogenase maturation protein HypF
LPGGGREWPEQLGPNALPAIGGDAWHYDGRSGDHLTARAIRVKGVVQGVGFRPFVFRLAAAGTLTGWVLNAEDGVDIHLEGAEPALDAFVRELETQPPPAALIASIDVSPATPEGFTEFTIRESRRQHSPSVRISPDLPVCAECLREMFGREERRFEYPYINCTNCGPRYTIVQSLPYDRRHTTMRNWPLDAYCRLQYLDPVDRRFHAQPVACPECGPHYFLRMGSGVVEGDAQAIARAAGLLRDGSIVAVKGLGGYHLVCDASNAAAVGSLRDRKFRKEKPFAVMVKDLEVARRLVQLDAAAEAMLTAIERPIVLAPARTPDTLQWDAVAPESGELGVMLPYTPLHYLLFAKGAPDVLVMTSANRSSEPIAFEDEDALQRLDGICDAFLIGQRPIARRVDDSVVRAGWNGPAVLRRARGYAPRAVARLPVDRPVLAVGADLKNAITLVVNGQAFVSQHIGDLDHYQAFGAFEETIRDLACMYDVRWEDLLVVHDCHPEYASTVHALRLQAAAHGAVQHHRAHIASVLAEREAWHKRVIGVSFDGTGFGDDGTIWGGEVFTGSVAEGFSRVAHLRCAALPGGDAAARFPVQAAAGFLAQLEGSPDFCAPPFGFPVRYRQSLQLAQKGVRTFVTSSTGRLFDTVAALLGFTRPISFEGQAAMWLEHLARQAEPHEGDVDGYAFPLIGEELDFRPLLHAVVEGRVRGKNPAAIARSFHRGLAQGVGDAVQSLGAGFDTVVLSGGVFQNEMLGADVGDRLRAAGREIWTNRAVPANDGGISLGQAALAAFGRFDKTHA